MADDPIHEHIAAVAARDEATTASLIARIRAQCWPGGADRSEPAALAWVRRWGPRAPGTALPACGCAGGRCGVCN